MSTQTISIIGTGAFGTFMIRHLTPFFKVSIFDSFANVDDLAKTYNVSPCATIAEATQSDIIIIAVPVSAIANICDQIAPHLRAGQLVMDVASVKILPTQITATKLPDDIDIIGLHPLFGPQSGKYSIHGQNITIVNVRGNRAQGVETFLKEKLHLNTITCTAEHHDQEMAYVQGLTHMIARVFKNMNIPQIQQETKTFSLLQDMVNIVKNDSDELFKTIQTDNPYVTETKTKFFDAVKDLEKQLDT